jgi:hypothetical protein
VAITRGGRTFLPLMGALFQAGDTAHVAVRLASAEQLKAMLGW